MLNASVHEDICDICRMIRNAEIFKEYLVQHATEIATEEAARLIPVISTFVANTVSFASAYYFLGYCLKTMEKNRNF